MKDYSQDREQGAILAAFEGSAPGLFLDIGAWHPKHLSNTRALFEMGWSGVIVEPSPYPMRNLLDEYGNEPRIRLFQAAVTLAPGAVLMQISDDAFSTTETQQFNRWKRNIRFVGQLHIPSITLEQLQCFGVPDFVSIDTEGTSGVLFRRMLDLGWRPRCVCVETDGELRELTRHALDVGYERTFENDVNGIFVRRVADQEAAA